MDLCRFLQSNDAITFRNESIKWKFPTSNTKCTFIAHKWHNTGYKSGLKQQQQQQQQRKQSQQQYGATANSNIRCRQPLAAKFITESI